MGPKLLLINPAMVANGQRLPNAGGMATMEPLALAYVAALTPPHWDVRIVDEVLEEIPDDFEPDLVGLTSLSITVPRAYEIARHYRERGVPVVMGGIHATLMPDEVLQYVDVVYQGEAEGNWPALIRDFEQGRMGGHTGTAPTVGKGKGTGTLQRRYDGGAAALQALPLPQRESYRHRYLIQLISASRGCRYRCEFCTLWKQEGGQYRARPPGEVMAELEATEPQARGLRYRGSTWLTAVGRRPILFTDENIFTDREWALALFRGMAERGFRRPFAVQASLDIADDEDLLQALKRSGCMTVLIGFESVSEASLRTMRKGVNLRIGVAHYKEKVDKLHYHGLAASGTFMFGNDGDDPDIFERTAEFVLEAGIDLAHFGLLTPNPGTDLFARLAREGRLLYTHFPADYARYDLRTAVFRPLNMTPEQLEKGLVWATQAVGSRWAVARRAWNTWRATKNPVMTAITLGWNRSGLYRRVVT